MGVWEGWKAWGREVSAGTFGDPSPSSVCSPHSPQELTSSAKGPSTCEMNSKASLDVAIKVASSWDICASCSEKDKHPEVAVR